MVRAIGICLALGAAVGCSSEAFSSLDGGVTDTGDGGPPGGGLEFNFTTMPPLPQVSSTVVIDEIRMSLREVRAIGDAAPGDDRTYLADLELDWRPDHPQVLTFPMAPPGIYSALDAHFGGGGPGHRGEQGGGGPGPAGGEGYDIRGTVTLPKGDTVPFEIQDDATMAPINVELDGVEVDPPAPTTAMIVLDLTAVINIDWTQVSMRNGELWLDESDPMTAYVSQQLAAGFSFGGLVQQHSR